ncbi:ExbD/TolR family protein [Parvularcula dongshanensis]|uniref:Biopolymer transport protein TolR n=1 Tax=Parvularcula dongshanensis TaxID=1173995 RepID=A0A840I8B6_9PROT|nr:biopolymer transporter ExbD [Parvularcula dongshanensis]MBB4660348.1 biopolymer transport protein TolR [Parvularcula dongshanensis]
MAGGIQPRGGRGRSRQIAEINVTPLVDVMLVLLIVFMVAAPLLTVGIEVELPETEARAITEQTEPLAVTLTADGTIYVQETPIEYDNLVAHLTAISQAGYDQRIYVRADQGVLYNDVARVMGRMNAAGFTSIGLVTD